MDPYEEDYEERAFNGKLLESKRPRNQAEDDARTLRNRIKMLEMEENKALKKLVKTKEKAHEILALKQRNHEKKKEKQEVTNQHILVTPLFRS